jgi:hypothetical protein
MFLFVTISITAQDPNLMGTGGFCHRNKGGWFFN